jgi:hypothetical protein
MNPKLSYLLFLLILALSACQLTKEFDYTSSESTIVVNSILNPDSTINIKISRTLGIPAETKTFPAVTNAKILLYENEQLIGEVPHDSEGKYKLEYYPKSETTYRLEIHVQDHDLIKATTYVPSSINASGCYTAKQDASWRTQVYEELTDNEAEENFYWLGIFIKDYKKIKDQYGYYSEVDYSTITEYRPVTLISEHTYLDDFNAELFEGNIEYFSYMRLEDHLWKNKTTTVDITSDESGYFFSYRIMQELESKQGMYFYVLNVSPAYDKYLKSTLTDFLTNDQLETENPFAEIVPIHSNIENGLGIFGAYSISMFPIHDNHCQ